MLQTLRVLALLWLAGAPLEAFSQLHLQQIGHLPFGSLSLSGCKGYVDSTGREWALIGTSGGVSIVDLQDPAQPVERFQVPGITNNWRELRTWNGFAYVGSEADSSGITIVDLRQLPDTIFWKNWFGDGAYQGKVRRSHTVQTANGHLFIFGGGNITDGAVIASLDDPWNPHIVGKFSLNYVHDGFIRGDTLWTSDVYKGQCSIVDISDIADPQLIRVLPTPAKFNHNAELSDDNRILFTTHETGSAPLIAFDVSDVDNIEPLDYYLPSKFPEKEVHNVRVIGDFLVAPSYGGQLTIVDAARPENLIETGWAIAGSSLIWDADPYLPSGIVIATAKLNGLYVYEPTYAHAAWLEGLVLDSITGAPVPFARVFVQDTPNADTSRIDGQYKTGAALSGTYWVRVEKPGYFTKLVQVDLQSGVVTQLNIELAPILTGVHQAGAPNDFKVSPTLFDGYLGIEVPMKSPFAKEGGMVQMLDAGGKVLLELPLQGAKTRIYPPDHLPSGMYLLRLRNAHDVSAMERVFKVE